MGGALRRGQAVRQAPEGCPQGRRPAGKGQPPGIVAELLGGCGELGGSQRGRSSRRGCLLAAQPRRSESVAARGVFSALPSARERGLPGKPELHLRCLKSTGTKAPWQLSGNAF